MVDGLKKVREPAAWLVLVGIGLGMVMDFVRVAQGATGEEGGWAFSTYAQALFGPGAAALLLVAVAACAAWEPRSPKASALAWTGAVIAGLGTLVQAVFGVIHLTRVAPLSGAVPTLVEAVDLIAFLLIPAAVTLVLVRLAGRTGQRASTPAIEAAPADDPNAPTWQPDQAAGAAWSTASGAAAGAGASGWGVPGERGGWLPEQGHQGHQGQQQQGPHSHQQQGQLTQGQPAYDQSPYGQQAYAQPGQGAHQSQPSASGPPIIYPNGPTDQADTTQFRGRWEPNRPE
ncbi:hypothetical protein [Mariniluteicoccus flavus]